jgi:hypothetical protein
LIFSKGRWEMKAYIMLVIVLVAAVGVRAEITVDAARGDVRARHGVTESWTEVAAGDVLKPNDSIRTGPGAQAVIRVEGEDASRTIRLPGDVIVELSDIRQLTQEELMLKLTMEKVRMAPSDWKTGELGVPGAAVVHGSDRSSEETPLENDLATGKLQLNGVRVLFDNSLYSTCILRGMEVFRQYPALGASVRDRMMVAEALSRTGLKGEALAEYGTLAEMEGLSEAERAEIAARMNSLRR